MSIQSQLNDGLFEYLPTVSLAIRLSPRFEANQMKEYACRKAMNSFYPIADMDEKEIKKFEAEVIRAYKHYGWMGS